MSSANPQDSIVCTVTIDHPMVCGKPHTRISVSRADKPGTSIIDWPNITALRHNYPDLAARLESEWTTQPMTLDELAIYAELSTFNAWPEPVVPANPNPHYIDFLPQPRFMRDRRA